jgi:hypothetical protein
MRAHVWFHPVFLPALLLPFACNTVETLPPGSEATLQVLETTCTDAWIRIELPAGLYPRTVRLIRTRAAGGDTLEVLTAEIAAAETTVVDSTLRPSSPYSYHLFRPAGVSRQVAQAAAATLDTTTHEFTWRLLVLGDGNHSELCDVDFIDDTTVCAVGTLTLRDSTGAFDTLIYNSFWSTSSGTAYRRIPLMLDGRSQYTPIPWLCAFGPDNVWFGNYNHWNGSTFRSVDIAAALFQFAVQADMCRLEGGVYVVAGGGGAIALSPNFGMTWRQANVDPGGSVFDLWGGVDRQVAMAVAGGQGLPSPQQILGISASGDVTSFVFSRERRLRSVWAGSTRKSFICGDGVFSGSGRVWREETPAGAHALAKVRGTAVNNVFVVGEGGYLAHFNGVSWRAFPELALPSGAFNSVACRGTMVAAVGRIGDRAAYLYGTRQ